MGDRDRDDELEALRDERNAAVRRWKATEAELAEARRDLKVARAAAIDAEAELARLRDAAAADATAALLRGEPSPRRRRAPQRGRPRRLPELAPGLADATPDAHRYLISRRANLLVVDGYNVTRAAWSGLAPEEERRRLVALLEDVQARSKGTVVVVFDGDDQVVGPRASGRVQVRFSASGETADDAIVALLDATPADRPVIVVSSDRAVATDARQRGAIAITAIDFLVASGR